MKKLICLFLALCLVLSGCSTGSSGDSARFYYCRIDPEYQGDDGIICAEIRDIQSLQDDPEALLAAYFSGPLSPDLELPFPKTTSIEAWKIDHGILTLQLSQDFSQLSGVDLTIACACITKTFLELVHVDKVSIRTGSNREITMSGDNMNLSDDSLDKLRTELTLYYTDEQRRYLLGFNIAVNMASQNDIVRYLIHELQSAPSGLGLVSAIPEGTRLLDSSIEDGTCTLHFSPEFETNAFSDSYAQRTTLLSIANTLCQLDDVDQVEIYIDSSLMAQYRQLNIIRALVYDESAIGPVRSGVNEFDATLYLGNGSEQHLAVVPTRIRQTAGSSQEELVLRKLIDYYNPNSYFSPVSPATRINEIHIANGLCTVDLSAEFLESDNLTLAVHAVIASLCSLKGVDRTRILINGKTPDGEYSALFTDFTPERSWYI